MVGHVEKMYSTCRLFLCISLLLQGLPLGAYTAGFTYAGVNSISSVIHDRVIVELNQNLCFLIFMNFSKQQQN